MVRTSLFNLLLTIGCLGLHLLAPCPLSAQSPADSLASLLVNAPPDTHRVILLVDYAWEINETATDEAERRLREALELAQKLRYPKGEAQAWNGLGVVEEIRGNFERARELYRRSLALRRQLGDPSEMASSINNLGNAFELEGQVDSALFYRREYLRLTELLRDTMRIARAHFNLAAMLQENGLYPEALTELNEARLVMEERGDAGGTASAFTQMGHIQLELDQYEIARTWYEKALQIRRRLGEPSDLADALTDYANALDETDSSRTALNYYLQALRIREELDDEPGQATIYVNLADAHKHLGHFAQARQYLERAEDIRRRLGDEPGLMEVFNVWGDVVFREGRLEQSKRYIDRYFAIAQKLDDQKYIQRAYKDYARYYAARGDFSKAYEFQLKYIEYSTKRLNEKIGQDFARKEVLFADDRKQLRIERQERQLERQQSDLALRDAAIARARSRNYALAAGALGLALVIGLLFNRNRLRAKANRDLAAKNTAIEQERARADDLLTNILPAATAAELKTNLSVQPVRYESVTVLFSDFKDFTRIAEKLSPEELVAELDQCFRLFDAITVRHGLEKIKTIGDAYMCAGGLPVPNDTHPVDAVEAAIEMQAGLQELMKKNEEAGRPVFEMRIGIHTGPVVAGVVGSHKFAYDIWGDTVNTAARLEQTSEPGRINISEATYQRVRHRFECTYRGKFPAKNKGEMDMYFVSSV